MRGEHCDGSDGKGRSAGSPPHARGTLIAFCPRLERFRITPACAGNTVFAVVLLPSFKDHPRMRGEHQAASKSARLYMGSPPHARGTRTIQDKVRIGPGITPACAGNTIGVDRATLYNRDHPRMRGEHSFSCSSVIFLIGSPPHARGTP